MTLTGVVLAGGDARRFGEDKRLFEVDGAPMIRRAVGVLRSVADRVVVSVRGRPASRRLVDAIDGDVVWLADSPIAPGGPLNGMLTALGAAGPGEILFVPTDMPWLVPAALRGLLRHAQRAEATSAAPLRPDGWVEALVQWHRVAWWTGRSDLLRGLGTVGSRPTDLLRGGGRTALIRTTRLSVDPRCWLNVNRPSDLQATARSSRRRPTGRSGLRSAEAARAFWTAVGARSRRSPAEALKAYRREARALGRGRIYHLELHALEDARACARRVGGPTVELGEGIAAARRALRG